MRKIPTIVRCATLACLLLTGHADAFFVYPRLAKVVEYHNTILDHYFMTGDDEEIAIVDAGGAGPGWERTGYALIAMGEMPHNPILCSSPASCPAVLRYYGAGPNSHFFTPENTSEAQIVARPESGWGYEKVAFWAYTAYSNGCARGQPVYRLYNNRWMYNDSNHRYVTTDSERQRMRAAGWVDEGLRFCVDVTVGP